MNVHGYSPVSLTLLLLHVIAPVNKESGRVCNQVAVLCSVEEARWSGPVLLRPLGSTFSY